MHALLDFEIYMEQPQGYSISSDGKKLVWRLHKSLYGLKQSGRNWNCVLRDHLIESGFVESKVDCLFVSRKMEGVVYSIFWVNDIIVAASNDTLLNQTKDRLSNKFRIKDLGSLKWFLGIEVKRFKESIEISQRKYFEKTLSKFNMQDCKPRTKPCDEC